MASAIGTAGRHYRRLGVVLALLCAAWLSGSVAAQQRSLISPGDAQMRRELRSLEGQAATSPRGAELELQRVRRDLVSRSRGVALSPEAARIERGLDQVDRDLQRQRRVGATQPVAPRPRATSLPSSYGDGDPLPSFDPSTTFNRLLGRAEQAVMEGRSAQARSDLATAKGFLPGLDPAAPTTAELLARMADVQVRLGGN